MIAQKDPANYLKPPVAIWDTIVAGGASSSAGRPVSSRSCSGF
jgi:hypothetical protein